MSDDTPLGGFTTLWSEELERSLTEPDVGFLREVIGLKMLGWYRDDQPTLGVRALARSGNNVALLRARRTQRGSTVFEATTTLPQDFRKGFRRVHAEVVAAIAALGSAKPDPYFGDQRWESERESDYAAVAQVPGLARGVLTAYDRTYALRSPTRLSALAELLELVEQLTAALFERSPFGLGRGRELPPYPSTEFNRAWRRVRLLYPQLSRPALSLQFFDRTKPFWGVFGWERDALPIGPLDLVSDRLVDRDVRWDFARWIQRRRRRDARNRLELGLSGYAMLAQAVLDNDRSLEDVGMVLLLGARDAPIRRRGRRLRARRQLWA